MSGGGELITVASLLAGEGAQVVKSEDGQVQIHVYQGEDEENRGRYYSEEASEGLEGYSDSSQGMPELEYRSQEGGQQDLVSIALQSSKVGQEDEEEEDWEGLAERNQLTAEQREELLDPPSPTPLELSEDQMEAGGNEDFPDEIECQLIQKNVLINGQIQSIDFIMCNQCPRLFRTENLLWNHIKAKHKRRNYRRPMQPQIRRPMSGLQAGGLEPGEIHPSSVARLEAAQLQKMTQSGQSNLELRSPGKLSTGSAANQRSLYVVGLEREGGGGEGQEQLGMEKPEKYQRQRAKKRIYVDSNTGPFKCPGCDSVTFSNRRALDLHMRKIHKAGIVECDECGRKVLDLKRHKEILHKRFKIYSCPHCSDKYCTQEDLERHLLKVEKNNIVKGVPTVGAVAREPPKVAPEQPAAAPQVSETEKEGSWEGETKQPPVKTAAADGIVKQMEAKTYSCSECGLKTPSRMTYIQHVLNGCIMDMVVGGSEDGADNATQQNAIKKAKVGEAVPAATS